MKNTVPLKRFITGFRTSVLPYISTDNVGLVYYISQSLADDPIVKEVAELKQGSGYALGTFMGITVKTMPDFKMEDYREEA